MSHSLWFTINMTVTAHYHARAALNLIQFALTLNLFLADSPLSTLSRLIASHFILSYSPWSLECCNLKTKRHNLNKSGLKRFVPKKDDPRLHFSSVFVLTTSNCRAFWDCPSVSILCPTTATDRSNATQSSMESMSRFGVWNNTSDQIRNSLLNRVLHLTCTLLPIP